MTAYNTGNGFVLANSAHTVAFTFTVPAGMAAGDVAIVGIEVFTYPNTTASFGTPSSGGGNWTQIGTTLSCTQNSGQFNLYGLAFYRVLTASDPGSTFTLSYTGPAGSTDQIWWTANCNSYTGFYTPAPIGAVASSSGVNGTSFTSPTATTIGAGSWGIQIGLLPCSGGGSITSNPSVSRQADTYNAGVDGAYSDTNGSAGATGSTIGGGTFTTSSSTQSAGMFFTIELLTQSPQTPQPPLQQAVRAVRYPSRKQVAAPQGHPFTVTATQGGSTSTGIALAVEVLTGQSGTQPGTTAAATNTTPSLAITPAQTGSRVYGSLLGISGTYTVNGATTNLQDAHNIGGLEMCSFVATATSTASTPETLGYTTTGANSISIALCEIEQGGTLATDPSTPAPVNSGAAVATAISSPPFIPPPGSLLVALVQSNGGGSVTTMAITDTSGLGLTWTEQVKQNVAGDGYSGVWTAVMPGGGGATTIQGTATITGQGAVSTADTTGSGGTMGGQGSLGPPDSIDQAPATLAGAGSLSGLDTTDQAPATLTGQGSITDTDTTRAPATLAGQGSITDTSIDQAPATLAGQGAVSDTAGTGSGGTMGGQGSLGTPDSALAAPATLTGQGSITDAAITQAPATLTGQGTLAASTAPQGTGTMGGQGSLGPPDSIDQAPATLAGQGALGAAGTVVLPGAATMGGQGQLATATAMAALAMLAGQGQVSATIVHAVVYGTARAGAPQAATARAGAYPVPYATAGGPP